MKPERRIEIESRAIKKYGWKEQQDMCVEEMSELAKALLKKRRHLANDMHNQDLLDNIVEEIADVQIMLDQMRLIFGDTADQENYKLNRLWARMEAQE